MDLGTDFIQVWFVMMTFALIQVDSQGNASSISTIESKSRTRKCAESFCLPDNYDKLEVPFDANGVVHVSVDFDTLQVLVMLIISGN